MDLAMAQIFFFFLNILFVIDGLSTQRTSEFTHVSQ